MNASAEWEEIERLFHEAVESSGRGASRLCWQRRVSRSGRRLNRCSRQMTGQFFAAPPAHLAADLLESQPGALAAWRECRQIRSGISDHCRRHGRGLSARTIQQGIPVALKILRRHLVASPQAADRFETEARAASALESSEHRHDLRVRRIACRTVHRDGVGGWTDVSRGDRRRRSEFSAGHRLGWTGGSCSGRGPCGRDPPPRHQAGEHHARQRRRAEDSGLRPGPP